MNDFAEIENELKKLQPQPVSSELVARIERAITAPDCRPSGSDGMVKRRFTETPSNWISLGLGLAAAAVILLFLHLDFQKNVQQQQAANVVANSPAPAPLAVATNEFVPAAATQVVYHMRDEGLVFRSGSTEPVRRMRSFTHETLQWRNPATGASLRVSYPTEQVDLIPSPGQ